MSHWVVGQTYSTHNHPTRYWETSILDPICGYVATTHSDTEQGSIQLARFIAAAPELLEALKELAASVDAWNSQCEAITPLDTDEARAVIAKVEGELAWLR